jgi:hypothetical protein
MRETVPNEPQLALLDVLLDGVERLLLGHFQLCVGPAGDLDDHVEDAGGFVCEEGDVVEGGDDVAVLFDVDAVLCVRERERERCLDGYIDGNEIYETHRNCWERR